VYMPPWVWWEVYHSGYVLRWYTSGCTTVVYLRVYNGENRVYPRVYNGENRVYPRVYNSGVQRCIPGWVCTGCTTVYTRVYTRVCNSGVQPGYTRVCNSGVQPGYTLGGRHAAQSAPLFPYSVSLLVDNLASHHYSRFTVG